MIQYSKALPKQLICLGLSYIVQELILRLDEFMRRPTPVAVIVELEQIRLRGF